MILRPIDRRCCPFLLLALMIVHLITRCYRSREPMDEICSKLGVVPNNSEDPPTYAYLPAFFKPGSRPKVVILLDQARWPWHGPLKSYDSADYLENGRFSVGPCYNDGWYEKILYGDGKHMLEAMRGQHKTWKAAIEDGLVAIAMVSDWTAARLLILYRSLTNSLFHA